MATGTRTDYLAAHLLSFPSTTTQSSVMHPSSGADETASARDCMPTARPDRARAAPDGQVWSLGTPEQGAQGSFLRHPDSGPRSKPNPHQGLV